MESEIVYTIVLGVVSSICATFVWFILSQLWDVKSRKVITNDLEIIEVSLYEIEQKISYVDDYWRVEYQIDRILDASHDALNNIKIMTFGINRCKRKMIITTLYDIIRMCEYSNNYVYGLCGPSEYEVRSGTIARCLGIETEFNVGYNSIKYLAVRIAINLNCGYNLYDSFLYSYVIGNVSKEKMKEILLSHYYFEPNSFKMNGDSMYNLRYNCFERKEYEQYVEKCFSQ